MADEEACRRPVAHGKGAHDVAADIYRKVVEEEGGGGTCEGGARAAGAGTCGCRGCDYRGGSDSRDVASRGEGPWGSVACEVFCLAFRALGDASDA